MAFITQCFDSIIDQDSDAWTCVVVDGNSTDGSREFLQRFQGDSRFKIVPGLGQGMYPDWSYCLKFVETEYFYFLPSDDICDSELVSQVLQAFDRCPQADVCHFAYDEINAQGKRTRTYEDIIKKHAQIYLGPHAFAHVRSGTFDYLMNLVFPVVYHTMNSLVYRRSLIDKLQAFDVQFNEAADIDWQIRASAGTTVVFLPDCLASLRRYSGQATGATSAVKVLANNLKVRLAALDRVSSNIFDDTNVDESKIKIIEKCLYTHLRSKYQQTLWSESFKRISQCKLDCDTIDLIALAHKESDLAAWEYIFDRISGRNRDRYELALRIIRELRLVWPPPELVI